MHIHNAVSFWALKAVWPRLRYRYGHGCNHDHLLSTLKALLPWNVTFRLPPYPAQLDKSEVPEEMS